MKIEQPDIRDLIATPFSMLGIIMMFITLPLFYIATTIGSKWTAKIVLKMYGK